MSDAYFDTFGGRRPWCVEYNRVDKIGKKIGKINSRVFFETRGEAMRYIAENKIVTDDGTPMLPIPELYELPSIDVRLKR
jgi:hypothetical protein